LSYVDATSQTALCPQQELKKSFLKSYSDPESIPASKENIYATIGSLEKAQIL